MARKARTVKRYKAINFDLDTQRLRERFGEDRRPEAYRAIGRYLADRGFVHRQGSGYRSTHRLSDFETALLVSLMYRDLAWLSACVRKLDVTNIGQDYDMDSIAREKLRSQADSPDGQRK